MRPFVCPVDRSLVAFEDLVCLTCGTELAYDRSRGALVAAGNGAVCTNRRLISCNWAAPGELCSACVTTTVRPNDDDAAGAAAWALAETAKRRLFVQLDDLGLATTGVSFQLLSSRANPVTTGHADGVITVDLAEGDDVHRESVRIGLGEAYRTMLGHLRHEIGHYYWTVLVDGTDRLDAFRERFGDERRDYASALSEHYGRADDGAWRGDHVSRYAASHPWEDWAECFAHLLLVRDVVQTAAEWSLTVGGPVTAPPVRDVVSLHSAPEDGLAFDALVATWLPLTYALNAVNRSLGQDDAYPFVLTSAVLGKLRFVDAAVAAG